MLTRHFTTLNLQPMTFVHSGCFYPLLLQNYRNLESPQVKLTCLSAAGPGVTSSLYVLTGLPSHPAPSCRQQNWRGGGEPYGAQQISSRRTRGLPYWVWVLFWSDLSLLSSHSPLQNENIYPVPSYAGRISLLFWFYGSYG